MHSTECRSSSARSLLFLCVFQKVSLVLLLWYYNESLVLFWLLHSNLNWLYDFAVLLMNLKYLEFREEVNLLRSGVDQPSFRTFRVGNTSSRPRTCFILFCLFVRLWLLMSTYWKSKMDYLPGWGAAGVRKWWEDPNPLRRRRGPTEVKRIDLFDASHKWKSN